MLGQKLTSRHSVLPLLPVQQCHTYSLTYYQVGYPGNELPDNGSPSCYSQYKIYRVGQKKVSLLIITITLTSADQL